VVPSAVLGYKISLARALFHLHNLGHIATDVSTEWPSSVTRAPCIGSPVVVQQDAFPSSYFFGRIILCSSSVPDRVSYFIEHGACDASRNYHGHMRIDFFGGAAESRTPLLDVYGEPT
jgi:hypothetical protein